MLSDHRLSPATGASFVALYDDDGQLMWVLPILRRPLSAAGEFLVGPNS